MPLVIGTLYKWKSKEKQENCISYREFMKAGKSQKVEFSETKADDSAIIAYTGGTTGKAKGERFLDIIPPLIL